MITLETMKPNPSDAATQAAAPTDTGAGAVMGWRLPGERLTPTGWAVVVAVFFLPVLAMGLLLDAVVQWVFGWCLGVWCWF